MIARRPRPHTLASLAAIVATTAAAAFAPRGGDTSEAVSRAVAAGEPGGPSAIDWRTIDGGGGISSAGTLELAGTIGQPDAGVLSGGNFVLTGGFWPLASGTGCAGDCDGNGNVGIVDFLVLLADWGLAGGPCDFDGGGVGITDFLNLLAAWGDCP